MKIDKILIFKNNNKEIKKDYIIFIYKRFPDEFIIKYKDFEESFSDSFIKEFVLDKL